MHPAGGMYVFGSPAIDGATIDVGDNKSFKIMVRNNSRENKYIQRITLNNKNYTKAYLLHTDILKGGELIIEMGRKPSARWGVAVVDQP
ncbi:MAG: glycoside hydrolase domain-containing protein [Ginsengibacter sp.]